MRFEPFVLLLFLASGWGAHGPEVSYLPWDDVNIPGKPWGKAECPPDDVPFRYRYLDEAGDEQAGPGTNLLEVSATPQLYEDAFDVGLFIVKQMTRYLPTPSFNQLASRGSVGLFTAEEKTTIFPEYCHLRDTPECAGRCTGNCAITCTGDGRKYDTLAGLGGQRATCLDDNFMCTSADPYRRTSNILVHEFAHTVHGYGVRYGAPSVYSAIQAAYNNAWNLGIWDRNSYAMVNVMEYFAEASGTYFNVNHHSSSSGGMNGCPSACWQTEEEARAWLKFRDPMLYETLAYTWSGGDDAIPGEIAICTTLP